MDIQRTLLFAAFGMLSLMLYQNWTVYQGEKTPIASAQNDTLVTPNSPDTIDTPNVQQDNVDIPKIVNNVNTPVVQMPAKQGDLIQIRTDLLDIKIDTLGGSISYAGLLKHPAQQETPDIPVVLMQDNAEQRYRAESGLTGSQSDQLPNHHTQFQATKSSYTLGSGDSLEVPLIYTAPNGIEYTKTYRFTRNSYRIEVSFTINNTTNLPWKGNFYAHLMRTEPDVGSKIGILSGRLPSFTGAAYFTPEAKYNKLNFSELAETDGDLPIQSPSGWIAMLQHYFVSAWIPKDDGKYRFYNQANTKLNHPEYKLGFVDLNTITIAPGQIGQISAPFYVGPKERDRLDAQNAKSLALTVDFGWLTVIAEPLFWVMRKIHGIIGNWGWTIILITILIKAMFLPLSAASYKSMAKMKKLAPRLKTLKERHGDDKQKFQQEMMKLYREEKVNPAGGCLPILVQIPVFIALYWVLLESVELRQAPWAFWIHDLSSRDPLYILPVIMGASMFLQQKLNPAPMDPMQQKIMMALPLVFTVFFLSFPAGLVLYWVVNNVLSIAQQWIISKRYQ